MENWRRVSKFEYEVSDLGRVRNRIGEVMHPFKLSTGIRAVFLRKGSKYYLKTVAQMVSEVFIPNPQGFRFVINIDKNKDNLRTSNLRWARINIKRKITQQEANHIRMSHLSYKHLQEIYGVSKSTIQKIKQGTIWKKETE
jgi:hypothetical protein